MKLSDIVSAAHGLVVYPEVALLLFLVAFIAVLVQIASGKRANEWERARTLPLVDEDER
ncbi:MAG TPA: hypothetical protein VHC69_18665 [Polyangiaceae bacterium]|nr:hypothetical protein [Polyangiaceae bacterium]